MKAQAGVIATSPAMAPEAAPRLVGRPSLHDQPAQQRCGGGHLGVGQRQGSLAVGAQGRTGVEPEPAEPQQPGAQEHDRQVVRPELRLRPAVALAEHQGQRQACGARVDVDRRATREVLHPQVGQPPGVVAVGVAEVEDPVRDREVDEGDPGGDEDRPAEELGPVRDGAGDQGRGDHREHQLEHREGQRGDLVLGAVDGGFLLEQLAETDRAEVTDEAVAAGAEGEGESEQCPEDADDADRHE
jgi:hypothetical protein